jgi:hypothetical protein
MAHGNLDLAAYHALFLTQEDLPTLRRIQDNRDDGSGRDETFDRHRGSAVGNAVWNGGDADAFWMIRDYRWVFPDADSAAGFLQAYLAEPGGGWVVPMPVGHVGEECVVVDDTTTFDFFSPPIRLEAFAYTFRISNVMASLSVTAGNDAPPGTLKLAAVTALATTAAQRIQAIIG